MSLPHAKKSFGQNFLIDTSAVKKIVEAAEIQKGETVLEIGPGTGLLTEALVAAGAKVVAIELDHDLIAPLTEKFGDAIELTEGDVLSMRSLPVSDRGFKLIANIPYNITSPILEKFLAHGPHPTRMILMVQKEVADRILANPPQMSLLSVVCQLYADCSRVTNVKAGSFRPVPKVDSSVVRFDLQNESTAEGNDQEKVIRVAKCGFSSPRKQLQNNLASAFKKEAAEVKEILSSIGLNPQIRAEGLTIQNWIDLAEKFL